jgi:DNA repair exonuclease SbcCD nuclease subunit
MSGMANILLFSDIHVHPHKRRNERLQDCLKTLDWVFQQAIENNVDAVLFGGDLLHERQKIDSLTYVETYKILKKYENNRFKTWLLLGNHDMWFSQNASINSILPFESLNNFTTVTETKELEVFDSTWHFLPYTHNPIDELEKLNHKDIEKKYLLGHISIDGAKLNSAGSIADVAIEHDGDMIKIDRSLFKRYKHSFFGHYHGAQKLAPNMEYIGSPLQLSFGEAGEQKHIILLDTKTNDKKYIENNFSPKHFYIKQSEIENVNKDELKNGFVVYIQEEDITPDQKKLIESKISDLGVETLQIRQKPKELQEHEITDAKLILGDENKLIQRYVEQVSPEGFDKQTLIDLGIQITRYQGN